MKVCSIIKLNQFIKSTVQAVMMVHTAQTSIDSRVNAINIFTPSMLAPHHWEYKNNVAVAHMHGNLR